MGNAEPRVGAEVNGGGHSKFPQCLSYSCMDNLPYCTIILKLNLRFGRVNVYINRTRVNPEVNKVGGDAVCW